MRHMPHRWTSVLWSPAATNPLQPAISCKLWFQSWTSLLSWPAVTNLIDPQDHVCSWTSKLGKRHMVACNCRCGQRLQCFTYEACVCRQGEDAAPTRVIVFAPSPEAAQAAAQPIRNVLWGQHNVTVLLPQGEEPIKVSITPPLLTWVVVCLSVLWHVVCLNALWGVVCLTVVCEVLCC